MESLDKGMDMEGGNQCCYLVLSAQAEFDPSVSWSSSRTGLSTLVIGATAGGTVWYTYFRV